MAKNNLYISGETQVFYRVMQPIPCLVEVFDKKGNVTWGRLILRPGMHVIASPRVFVCPDGKVAFPADYDGNDPDYWPIGRLQRCAPLTQKIDYREFGNGFMKEEQMIKKSLTEGKVTYVTGREPEVQALVRAAFPDYRGNKVKIHVTDSPVNIASYWEGGSRDYYVIVRLASMQVADVPGQSAFDRQLPVKEIKIPDGVAIVQHSISLGKDAGITIHISPSNATKMLGDGKKDDLTRNEKIVLIATRSYKSSYQGDNQIRFHEAQRQTGITRPEWESAKESLTRKKMLNAAGAITIIGKNAIGNTRFYNLKESTKLKEQTTSCSICHKPVWIDNKPVGDVVDAFKYDYAGDLDYINLMHRSCALSKGYKIDKDGHVVGSGPRDLHEAHPSEKIHPKLHFYLVSAVTEYDKTQQGKPGFNRYALPQYLSTIEDIEDDIREGASVRSAIETYFSGRLLTFVLKWVAKLDKKLVEEIEPTLPKSFGQFIQK